jgi:hypothetical protein
MQPWKVMLRVDKRGTRLIVTDALGHDLVKAVLPLQSDHPRALVTMLEGLALYSGSRLCVATSVVAKAAPMAMWGPLGEGSYPIDSALVRFEFVEPTRSHRRLKGMGSFRDVRQLRLIGEG